MFSSKAGIITRTICRHVIQNQTQLAQSSIRRHTISQAVLASNIRLLSTSIARTADKLTSTPAVADSVAIFDKFPDVKITRKIVGAQNQIDLDLVLFQYQTCPFCCKVRVFLDSQGFSYSVVEVDAVLRHETKWSSYKKVPMMLAKTKDGKYVQLTDSSSIVSILATVLENPTVDIVELARRYAEAGSASGGKDNGVLSKYHLALKNPTNSNE